MANYTILLIDYEPRSIERFRDPLTAAGYVVEIANDGISGIEAFHRLMPDMVLVEAMIPKKHGFEVCQELKRTPHGRRTPVLITSGVYKGRKYRTQALHIYGCDEYIEKPIAPAQLLEIVGRFLGPEGSASSARLVEEPAAAPTDGRGPRTAHDHGKTNAQGTKTSESAPAKGPRTTPDAQALSKFATDGEDEIMARLDAILPTGNAMPRRVETAPAAAVAMFDPAVEGTDEDPLAQIRAELNAELGAFDIELGGSDPTITAPVPSDQAPFPSVFEALPAPEPERPIAQPLPVSPRADAEKPGQVVDFDGKRARGGSKKKRGGRAAEATEAAEKPQAAPALVVPAPVLPQSTVIKVRPDAVENRRAVPVWAWGAGAVVTAVALYFVIFSPGSTVKPSAATPSTTPSTPTTSAGTSAPAPAATLPPKIVETKPVVATERPVASAPVASAPVLLPPVSRPAASSTPKVPAPPPKKSLDHLAATTPAAQQTAVVAPPVPKPSEPPVATVPKPVAAAPVKPPPPAAQTPPSPDDNVAGVETVPDAADASHPAALAPGVLVPIDEAEVLPVSLTHKYPPYPPAAKAAKLGGSVLMNVLVNERGTVDQVVLVQGVQGSDELSDAAVRAAKSWTYRPATKRGVPVKVWKSEQVEFKP
jgi:TonB family protein